MELTFSDDAPARLAFARDSVGMARRVDDSALLVHVLHLTAGSMLLPETLQERLSNTADALGRSEQLDDPSARLNAAFDRALTAIEAGLIDEVESSIALVVSTSAHVADPNLLYFAATLTAGAHLFAGRFEAAEAAAAEILAIGMQSGQPDVVSMYGAYLFSIRREEGRLEELAEHLSSPDATSVVASGTMATILLELGHLERAREFYEIDAKEGFRLVRNSVWMHSLCVFAVVCAEFDDAPRAEILAEMIAPFADHIVCAGQFWYGSTRYYLGLLATVTRDFVSAERHYREALITNDRVRAPGHAARTRVDWARMLVRRGHSGDAAHARLLLEEGLAAAERLGCRGIQDSAASMLKVLSAAS